MDFSLPEECEELRRLAREILADHSEPARLAQLEATGAPFDAKLWSALADAGLLGVALPEGDGGAGLGPTGLCVLLEEQGRHVTPVPLWPALVAALTVAAEGTPEQRAAVLPALADGSARATLALEEYAPQAPREPLTAAQPAGDAWTLSGRKAAVPAVDGAEYVLVTAVSDEGPGLFLVSAGEAGLAWEFAETTDHDRAGHLILSGVRGERLGDSGAVDRVVNLAAVATAAVQLGVADGALAYAVRHLSEREQFGRPLATFQAVRHQLADCSIELDAMRVTLWQAVTALEDGEDLDAAVSVAKWWASEGGLNVVHRVQHVHGGIGVDTEYPVHRHFLWGKQLAGTLGGSNAELAYLGTLLAAGREAS